MQIVRGIDGLKTLLAGAVVSVGNFDGMHRGHGRIISMCRELARETGSAVGVVTFEPHPLTVLRPEQAPPRLTPASLKEELIAQAGADYLVVLPPEPAVLNLLAEDFWHILRDDAKVAHLVEGANFTFGKGRGGNVTRLSEWVVNSSVKLHVPSAVEVVLLDLSVVAVSSSLIRWLVANGRVRDAAICLGRPYVLEGEVVKGHQRGRTIGVPTANLRCSDQLTPTDAVYVGRCTVDGATFPAAVSIGTMPTFGDNQRQIEAHLIGYSGDLYGRMIRVELIDWVREQRKYAGMDPLKKRIEQDMMIVRERNAENPATPIALA